MGEIPKISTVNQKPVINKQEEAKKLLKKVKDSGNNELRYRMIQEYKKLNYDKVKDIFLQTTKKDLKKLSSEKNISYRTYLDVRKAKQGLENTNKIYSEKNNDNILNKISGFWDETQETIANQLWTEGKLKREDFLRSRGLNNLNKRELREFQEIQIKKILGTNKGYNGEYLQGFNKEKGNYLIKISDFEKKIEKSNIKNVNSKELENYIKYLVSIDDNYKVRKIISRLEKEGINNYTFFNPIEIYNSDIKEIQNPIFSMIKSVKDKFNEFMDNLLNFDNINNFIEEFKGNSKIEQEEIINHLKNGLENYKQDFINSIISSLTDKYSKEEKEEIANTFVEDIINTTKTDDIILKIGNFNKNYNSNINIKKSTEDTLKIKVMTQKIKTSELIYEGKYEEAKISDEKMKQVGKDLDKMFLLDEKQSNYLYEQLQNGESFDNIIQEIAQDNKELRDILDKEKENNEKSNPGVENKGEEKKEDNNKYYIDKYDYIKSDSGYTIKLENGDKIPGLVITQEERDQTMGNPEGLKNLVNFYKFFKNLNLEGVWKYRKELAKSMGDVNININDNNSISETELIKFGKKLIQIINSMNEKNPQVPHKAGYKISENIGNLSGVENALRTYSGSGGTLNENATFNILGEDRITAQFRRYKIIGGAYFHTMQLRKLMKK